MKAREVRERGSEELRTLLDGLNEELYKKKIDHAVDQLKQTHRLSQLRKEIARIRTILRERELGEQQAKTTANA